MKTLPEFEEDLLVTLALTLIVPVVSGVSLLHTTTVVSALVALYKEAVSRYVQDV